MFPLDLIEAARQELEEFVHILEGEGVTVKRPDALRHDQQYSTGSWARTAFHFSTVSRMASRIMPLARV